MCQFATNSQFESSPSIHLFVPYIHSVPGPVVLNKILFLAVESFPVKIAVYELCSYMPHNLVHD